MWTNLVPYQQIALGRTLSPTLQAPLSWVMPASKSMDVREHRLLVLQLKFKMDGEFSAASVVKFSLEESIDTVLPFKEIASSVINITQTNDAVVMELPLAGYNFIRPRFDSLHFEGIFTIHITGMFK